MRGHVHQGNRSSWTFETTTKRGTLCAVLCATPCARTRFYLDSDRASCFETSGLYWRCQILPPPSSLPRLPPPSSSYQPNPMLQTIRAVNSMALGFRPLPPPSSLLPSTPKTNPLCAALCAPPMRGTRLSIDLDRAPCFETSPPTRKLCASPYARDTIFNGFRSCTLLRNHYKKRDPMRKPLCAGHDFQWI